MEEVSKLLTTAGEELLADQVDELADLVDVVAISGEEAKAGGRGCRAL